MGEFGEETQQVEPQVEPAQDAIEDARRALIHAKELDRRSATLAYVEGRNPRDLERREPDAARKLLLLELAAEEERSRRQGGVTSEQRTHLTTKGTR